VTTTIDGFYDGPLSDTGFWIDVRDHLGVTNGDITCTTTLDSGHDTTLDTIAAAIGAIFGLGDGAPDPSAPSFLRVGPACQAAAAAPSQILIPKNLAPVPLPLKEVFTYSRAAVSGSGIVMGGTHETALRELRAVISGQYRLEVAPGQMTSAQFFALPFDLRAPLRATWSAPGGVVSVVGTTAFITWDSRSLRVGQSATYNIALTITDADGFSASTSATIRVTAKTPPPDDPPTCQKKPTLPQCR